MKKYIKFFLILPCLLAALALADLRQSFAADALVVTLNKARALSLPADARHVVVGNPAIADVTVETPRLLFLFGKVAGETSLVVLDGARRPILDVSLIVSPEDDRHVSVHGPGAGAQSGSVETNYSCGSRCVRVLAPAGGAGQ